MRGAGEIGPPERLSAEHDLSTFASGEPALNDWLRRRAQQNDADEASRTYVVCVGRQVVALATGAMTVMITVAEAVRIMNHSSSR